MSGASTISWTSAGSAASSRANMGNTLDSDRLNLTRFSQVDCIRSISNVSSLITPSVARECCDITTNPRLNPWRSAWPARARSFAHQEDERPDVVLRSPLPVAHEDRIDHDAGLALAPEQEAERLRDEVLTRQTEEDADGVDQLADVGDRVGDRDRARHLDHEIVAFPPDPEPQIGKELAPVVEQVHVDEGERPPDGVVAADLGGLAGARRRRRGAQRHQIDLLSSDRGPEAGRSLIGERELPHP